MLGEEIYFSMKLFCDGDDGGSGIVRNFHG